MVLLFQGMHSVQNIYAYLETLASQTHPQGGWGYRLGQKAQLEPTCLALLALSLAGEESQAAIRAGEAMLQTAVVEDGAYRLKDDREEAIWPTALVLFVQAVREFPRQDVERSASRLLSVRAGKPNDQQT